MSLNYSVIEAIKLLPNAFKYNVFIAIIISGIILNVIFYINRNKKIVKYLTLLINLIILLFIIYFYIKDIFTFNFNNPINNIYFYFFNTIVYIIIFSIKLKYNIVDYIFYLAFLINILFSIFMTHYLNNVTIIVIGNIFPMIKFGNIFYFIYYLILLLRIIINKLKRAF